MKSIYRDCEIKSSREQALGGWGEVYWSAFRVSDGYCINEGFGGGDVRDCFRFMKSEVDEFLDKHEGNIDKHSGYE